MRGGMPAKVKDPLDQHIGVHGSRPDGTPASRPASGRSSGRFDSGRYDELGDEPSEMRIPSVDPSCGRVASGVLAESSHSSGAGYEMSEHIRPTQEWV